MFEGTLGFDHAFAAGSSGRSGGLCIYWKDPIKLDLRNFSKNHVDMRVLAPKKDLWRLTLLYGEANRSLCF
jgi:hypothetical protein